MEAGSGENTNTRRASSRASSTLLVTITIVFWVLRQIPSISSVSMRRVMASSAPKG